MNKLYNNNIISNNYNRLVCVNIQYFVHSACLRGDKPALGRQTGCGWRTQGSTEGLRRTPRLATGAFRSPFLRRQFTCLDSTSQLHHGHSTLHRTTKRRKS